MPNGTEYGPITSLLFVDNIQNLAPVDGVYPRDISGRPNPYEVIDRVKASQEYYRYINDIQVKIRPFDGATLNYTFGMDNTNGVGLLNIPYGFNSIPNGAAERNTDRSMMYNSDINFNYK